MTEENFTSYEMMLIVDPTLGDDRTRDVIEELKTQIKSLEGTVTFEDLWGSRYLSYKIKRQEKGYYVVLNFNLAPTKLIELTNELRLNQNILRFITLKTPKNYEILTLEALEKEAEKFKKVKKEDAKEEEAPRRTSRPAPKAKVEEPKVKEVEPEEKVEEKEVEVEKEVKEKPAKKTEVEEKEEIAVEEEAIEEEVEEKEEVKEEPKKKEAKITDLDDVDAKLKSIIDDPDISL
ncbi:MAG TPA: 30S ribosomal protein S6 [Candidatus Gracilibacteria bacterium]|nr:30S ribosomal protein S6 [Candidatus Gracilibacteria bacterium]